MHTTANNIIIHPQESFKKTMDFVIVNYAIELVSADQIILCGLLNIEEC